jgi:multicomponent Na+:H+ antiporter subunit E
VSVGKFIATFACLFAAWVAFTGSIDVQELAAGAVVAALVALISHEVLFKRPMREKFRPKRLGYALAYVPAYVWEEIKAHADVIYRILHPKMPIKPGIVKVPTDLRTDFGITGLANAITMTPGTISVEVNEDEPGLYVHWINVKAVEPAQTKVAIAGPFERFLKKVFG